MIDLHIEAIFCDDIREEIGNKRSLMGIYQGEMFVTEVPVILPKLCVYINLVSDVSKPVKKVEVKLVKGPDEKELVSTGVIEPQPGELNPNDLGVSYSIRTLVMALGVSPFMIDEETIIRVVAETDQGKIYGPCLRIRTAQNYNNPA